MTARSKASKKSTKHNLIVRVEDEILAWLDEEVMKRKAVDPGGSHTRSTVVRGFLYEKLRS